MKGFDTALLTAMLALSACQHGGAVGTSGARYARAYADKGYFAPYDAAAMNARVATVPGGVVIIYPADEEAVTERCRYMGNLAAPSGKHAQVFASRIGGIQVPPCETGSHRH